MTERVTSRRWMGSAVVTVLLVLGLVVTTLAIGLSVAERPDNIFSTEKIWLNLNNRNPVITEGEYLFEPGMTVNKTFFLQNEGAECWYRLYFDKVSGSLASVMDVTVSDDNKVLLTGKMSDLTKNSVDWLGILPAAENTGNYRHNMTITFHLPEDAGNAAQGGTLQFDLCADGTQVQLGDRDKVPDRDLPIEKAPRSDV